MLPLPSPDEMQPGFKEAMHKATLDGLKAAAVSAAEQNYLKTWKSQPWWWRKTHRKMAPQRNGVKVPATKWERHRRKWGHRWWKFKHAVDPHWWPRRIRNLRHFPYMYVPDRWGSSLHKVKRGWLVKRTCRSAYYRVRRNLRRLRG